MTSPISTTLPRRRSTSCVAGLLALGLLVGHAATASAGLVLQGLGADETTPDPPVWPDWRGHSRPHNPARASLAQGALSIEMFQDLPELAQFRGDGLELAAARGRSPPEAVVLAAGRFDLAGLTARIADPDVLAGSGRIFTLRRPLVIRHGASLLIGGNVWLRLDAARGAAIVNAGRLIVTESKITSWDAARARPSRLVADDAFRPFIAGIGGSWTEIRASTLRHLGYHSEKAYGLSFTSGPARLGQGAPRGLLVGNRVVGNYYGVYSYEAEDVVIAGNEFRDSIVYGIDPHDRSKRLLIADNRVVGTRRGHGIVLSREVIDSWIVGNLSVANAGSGIVLDRQSTGNLVAQNVVAGNGGDGISLMESPHNLLWGNLALGSARAGLRVRNSWDLRVYRNRFAHNGVSGIEIYIRRPDREASRGPRPDPDRMDLTPDAMHDLGQNLFRNNGGCDLSAEHPGRLDLWGALTLADSLEGQPAALRLCGDLRRASPEIKERLDRDGGVRIIDQAVGAS
jgi:poly(beta-D-mannuronate) C5 epimerase